ncbi:MAG: N-acetylglucosaminyldiphosphoundecaprenol N-acetyl-beta-D-mannosaminyltransferase [Patescibacteria group bacterium]|nr:N-acetylglucosaminyldiphosphoundecaprenol N-acetyl-beta-D-mannosaminyltransferase [Patescibacteria group bacterium]
MAQILGIKLSDLTYQQLLFEIEKGVEKKTKRYIVTPNPEIILAALKDENLKNIINSADFSLADGFGLKLAGLLKNEKIIRITGSDLSLKILALAQEKNYKVAIIIWEKGLSSREEVKEALNQKYPKLVGAVYKSARVSTLDKELIKKINEFAPTILFVALGFPEQEKVIAENLADLKTVKLALGVGGTFDFITKKARRAPKLLRYLGLEWLWRLIIQPKRIKRIWRATVVFIYKVLTYKKIK